MKTNDLSLKKSTDTDSANSQIFLCSFIGPIHVNIKNNPYMKVSTFLSTAHQTKAPRYTRALKSILLVTMLSSILAFNPGLLSAQIGVRGISTNTSANTSTLTIPKPSGLAVGDVMIVNIMQGDNDNDDVSDATSSGWTEIAGNDI